MDIFCLTLSQMLTMFTFILVGYFLRKSDILVESSQSTLSKLETYFLGPALILYTWMNKCTPITLRENSTLILYGLALVSVAVLLSYPLSRLFVRKAVTPELEYQRNIYKYAMVFANHGFLGNFLVLEIWGSEMFFKYSIFTLFLHFITNSWGVFILIPKSEGRQNLKDLLKRILNPQMLALLAGMVLGLCNVKEYVPEFITNALSSAGDCMGPVAMVLAGVVIGSYDIKELLTYKKVYLASLMRLIILPACFATALILLDTPKEILSLVLVAFAAPLGMNTIVFPAAYGGDVKTGASMTMISSVLSVVTLPLMYLVFIVPM